MFHDDDWSVVMFYAADWSIVMFHDDDWSIVMLGIYSLPNPLTEKEMFQFLLFYLDTRTAH